MSKSCERHNCYGQDVCNSSSSASSIIPYVNVLKMLLRDEGPTTVGIKTLRQVMRESLTKRFAKLEETKSVILACLLDPRYKNHAFSSEDTHSSVDARDEGTSAHEVDVEEVAKAEGDTAEQSALKGQRRDKAPSGSRIDAMFSSLLGPHTGEASVMHSLDEELCVYLMEPLIVQVIHSSEGNSTRAVSSKKVSLLTPLICSQRAGLQ